MENKMNESTTPATATLECGHNPTPTTGIGSAGYATFRGGERLCYACADSALAHEVAVATPGAKWYAGYVSCDGRNITSWSGGVLMTNVALGEPHHKSSGRRYITAVDVDGRVWSGTGAPGEYAPLRLTARRA